MRRRCPCPQAPVPSVRSRSVGGSAVHLIGAPNAPHTRQSQPMPPTFGESTTVITGQHVLQSGMTWIAYALLRGSISTAIGRSSTRRVTSKHLSGARYGEPGFRTGRPPAGSTVSTKVPWARHGHAGCLRSGTGPHGAEKRGVAGGLGANNTSFGPYRFDCCFSISAIRKGVGIEAARHPANDRLMDEASSKLGCGKVETATCDF